MSSNLYWKPVPRQPEGTELGTGLKFALREELGHPVDAELDAGFIPWLRGLVAGSGDSDTATDAKALIKAIEQHGDVHVREVF